MCGCYASIVTSIFVWLLCLDRNLYFLCVWLLCLDSNLVFACGCYASIVTFFFCVVVMPR